MRPLEVPRMKKKDLLQRLAEEKRAAMEGGSLCDSTYLTYTHPDGTVERRPRVGGLAFFFFHLKIWLSLH